MTTGAEDPRAEAERPRPARVFTVGHSTRPIAELVEMLRRHGVEEVVDVRTVPRSRRNPQFNREALAESLAAAGLGYRHMPGLGGLRKPRPDSENTGWRNAGFRGYADYMATPEFARSLAALVKRAEERRAAIMCAEAVPWRCHRSLVADALTVRGVEVAHIMDERHREPHRITAFARVAGTEITYPPADAGDPRQPTLL